jgi:peptidoglycan/xylan/chitin deacetylase (PgdA/CDA1 family)
VDVALTFDDLPGRGYWRSPGDRLATVDALVRALARHGVSGAYGFVNAAELAHGPETVEVIERWTAAGHKLGNHTYSHLDLHGSHGTTAFLADVAMNEAALDWLPGGRDGGAKMFRFPYLNAGETDDRCRDVDGYLRDLGYRVAEVTVDFADWRWNSTDEIAVDFVNAGVGALRQARTLAGVIFRRPIAHVLLLHFGAATARHLDALLEAYAAEGAHFVALERALADPAYATAVEARPRVGTFLNKIGRAMRLKTAR